MYAECPYCHAIFRVTPTILRLAKGKVRCGECDTVFDAEIDPDELEKTEKQRSDISPSESTAGFNLSDSSPEATQLLTRLPEFGLSESPTAAQKSPENMQDKLPPPSQAPITQTPPQGVALENTKPATKTRPKKVAPVTNFLIASFALGLVILLFAQYLYKNHVELSQYDSLRPTLTQLCKVANCTLPLQIDTKKIALLNHGIYSHPNIEDALMIKATIVNQAGFPQPLPVIELTLSNIRGKKMALRRFTPAEYLTAETLPEDGIMLENKNISVSIQVKDPGKNALAFEFEFI